MTPAPRSSLIPVLIFSGVSYFLCARFTASLADHGWFDMVLGPNVALVAAASTYWLWPHSVVKEWEEAAFARGVLRGIAIAVITVVGGWFLTATWVYFKTIGVLGLTSISLGHVYSQYATRLAYWLGFKASTLGGLLFYGVVGYLLALRDRLRISG